MAISVDVKLNYHFAKFGFTQYLVCGTSESLYIGTSTLPLCMTYLNASFQRPVLNFIIKVSTNQIMICLTYVCYIFTRRYCTIVLHFITEDREFF